MDGFRHHDCHRHRRMYHCNRPDLNGATERRLKRRNAELHQWRKNVHDLNLHITELSLLGEMVADWDSTDVNEYHSLRLEVDSMLEGIAGICPKEDSEYDLLVFLQKKEQLLLDIKDAMQELNRRLKKS